MVESRGPLADVANLLAVIERAAADLSLAEEPSRFMALLEDESGEEEER